MFNNGIITYNDIENLTKTLEVDNYFQSIQIIGMRSLKKFNERLTIQVSHDNTSVINITNLKLSISDNWSINVF